MLKAAVVGLGWWGRYLIEHLDGSDRLEVVGVVDVDVEAARPFTAARGLRLTASYDEVLADPGVDAILLATPHAFHEEQVLAAAAAGKQVFCEKPLALTGAAAERMLSACDAKSLVLGVGHERRLEGAFEELRRRALAGELGTLLHLEINASYNLFANNPALGWRLDPKHAPGGALTALGVHLTDYMQTVAGPVARLFARTAHRSADYPGEDVLAVQFEFASGVTGTLANLASTPFYQRISVFGDRAWVESRETTNVDDPAPAVMTWRGLDGEIRTRTFHHTDTVRANLHAWADAVAGRREYHISRAEKLHNVQILEAIVKSAGSGQVEQVG